jgi:hypothetical protein
MMFELRGSRFWQVSTASYSNSETQKMETSLQVLYDTMGMLETIAYSSPE